MPTATEACLFSAREDGFGQRKKNMKTVCTNKIVTQSLSFFVLIILNSFQNVN